MESVPEFAVSLDRKIPIAITAIPIMTKDNQSSRRNAMLVLLFHIYHKYVMSVNAKLAGRAAKL